MNAIDATSLMQHLARVPERDTHATPGGQPVREQSVARESTRAPARAEAPQREDMEALLERFAQKNTSLSFQVDDESGRTVILVRDSATSEVIKQIPSEDMIRVAERLEAHLENLDDGAGLLLTDQV